MSTKEEKMTPKLVVGPSGTPAGTVCAGNRFPLFVPCHRVVAANGLGPYGSLGTSYKERMLAVEGR